MNTNLVKTLKLAGGLVVVSEVCDAFGKAQAFKAMHGVYPDEVETVLDVCKHAENYGAKGYAKLKCKSIEKMARVLINR